MEENKAQETQVEESAVGGIAASEASEGAAENTASHDTENTNTASFDDGEGGESAEAKPKKQSDALNREYARKRRESENARKIEEARVNAVIETLGGVNPYTNDKMTDATDVEEYLLMKRIEKEGGDPLTDYARYRKAADKDGAKSARDRADKDEWYANDRDAFTKAHPNVNLSEILADEGFQAYADGKVGRVPLATIYEGYQKIVGRVDGKAKDLAAQAIANKQASPGSTAATGAAESDFFTQEQVRKMSKKEIHENYDKIRKSMSKW